MSIEKVCSFGGLVCRILLFLVGIGSFACYLSGLYLWLAKQPVDWMRFRFLDIAGRDFRERGLEWS